MALDAYKADEVVAVKVNVNGTDVADKTELPVVASLGLHLYDDFVISGSSGPSPPPLPPRSPRPPSPPPPLALASTTTRRLTSSLTPTSPSKPTHSWHLHPPSPAPDVVVWATSATCYDNSSTSGAILKRMVGPPSAKVLAIKACKATTTLGWVPSMKSPSYAVANFNVSPLVIANRVESVDVYLLSRGTSNHGITSIDIQLMATAEGVSHWTTIYTASAADRLVCPGIKRFPVKGGAAQLPITQEVLGAAQVAAVKIHVNGTGVADKSQLPIVAAVGLNLGDGTA
ncbi:hypothetical protein Agub_g14524 [Astrephomene gubernaculifera]|uniref:Uncharacterized protein n=1 Tax=Astrephomene gubernaculifera TaxID=47775 RepID=A0AAD3E5P3_9CHLO|nr:hypothetical protein Agub_g14524 [Astrephomene gubernaculifera]